MYQNDKEWSEMIGELSADVLVDAGIIDKENFILASKIIAEEVWVRLLLGDRPVQKPDDSSEK